jgi:hypothetical protein
MPHDPVERWEWEGGAVAAAPPEPRDERRAQHGEAARGEPAAHPRLPPGKGGV